MRVATLQFNPHLGAVEQNISHATALISALKPGQVDLLVLNELAFTGYNFSSLAAISPYLEPTTSGPTTEWCIQTARYLQCHVIAGYPEIQTSPTTGKTAQYNSTVAVGPNGEVLANYRKSFLYYTDETWAAEGPNGSATDPEMWSQTSRPFFIGPLGTLGTVGHGICMDINPYRFMSPWTDYEFASTMLSHDVRLVVLSMAWLTHRLPQEIEGDPATPDMETVGYWRHRFAPFIAASLDKDIVVVFANRCGIEGNRVGSVHVENGMEIEEGDRVCYAGSSCVMKFQAGGVRMYERGEGVAILGKGEEGVLFVDTEQAAKYSLQSGPV
ncbi:uncharacterized protein LTR77_007263 [Saxophila tyrrhenica]|uniref:CN hydrolase domain-containing protein n=1 Tax=Saxophila tyrrhenica TaxID=1690608 RepID=A0AAV9P426_9PEZI|nr:hypothetical protein LTR77_007263 [Saxophila tyrrhenica]